MQVCPVERARRGAGAAQVEPHAMGSVIRVRASAKPESAGCGPLVTVKSRNQFTYTGFPS